MRQLAKTKAAAPKGSGNVQVVADGTYPHLETPATENAVAKIASRYRLTMVHARLVCHLAGLGGVA